jgi:L-aspartate oxidase
MKTPSKRIFCEYLILGSGLAGLSAALKAARHGKVIVLTKREAKECNSNYAQGGIACVITDEDSFDEHVSDTLKAGAGLCHQDVVRQIVSAGPDRIQELLDLGVHFTTLGEIGEPAAAQSDEEYHLGREGGHGRRRVLHSGDVTGQELIRVLLEQCQRHPNIEILEQHMAIDLLATRRINWQGDNCCLGAYAMDCQSQQIKTFISKYTILATGGAGKVYLYTSNPDVACGDGVAMAYRAYAEIANMEFFQFHPTCLFHPHAKSFLISEAVRGEGAVLKLKRGDNYVEFMDSYHPMASLAPRDIVARAIDHELKRTGADCVYLDIRHHDEAFLRKRFPNIFAKCLEFGINMATDPIPIVPAAHYCCGGVRTDINGCTSVKNLYAAGEVGCTGLHGANRLASNSLLEAMVIAHNAIEHSRNNASVTPFSPIKFPDWHSGDAIDSDEQIVIAHNWDEIRRFMWDYVGIVRSDKRLERAKRRIRMIRQEIEKYYWDFLLTPDLVELRNLASVAEMIIDSAQARRESRGLHYSLDYPTNNEPPGNDTILRRPARAVIWNGAEPQV